MKPSRPWLMPRIGSCRRRQRAPHVEQRAVAADDDAELSRAWRSRRDRRARRAGPERHWSHLDEHLGTELAQQRAEHPERVVGAGESALADDADGELFIVVPTGSELR